MKYLKKFSLFIIYFLFISTENFSQIKFLDSYSSHQTELNKVKVFAGNSLVEFKFFRDDIIKINFFPDSSYVAEDSSFVIIRDYKNSSINFDVRDEATKLIISTDSIKIEISKYPLRIYYYDSFGKLLLKEKSSGGLGYLNNEKYSFSSIQNEDAFYGLGEKGISLNRINNSFDTYNKAFYGYDNPLKTMNINIPFLQSPLGYGIYFDITYPGIFDIGDGDPASWYYKTEDGQFNYYFIYAFSLKDILKKYFWLTGNPEIPPKWAFGYLQSKYGYRNQLEAENIVNNFINTNIPIDAIILDLYWFGWEKMGNMSWDYSNWQNPIQMMSSFKSKGIKTIVISEPYINLTSSNYNDANANNYFAKHNGNTYVYQNFWASPSSLLDLTNPSAQNWWWNKYRNLVNQGVEGFWTDLGEPENHPDFLEHYLGSARKVHNIYNLIWAKTIFEGYQKDFPDKRIFNLTRSGFAGIQKYGAITWSGDVSKTFNGLKIQIPMLQGMIISGIPYHNSDIGGFVGNTTAELFTRWIQFGAFSPIMRPHSSGQSVEPWSFGNTTEQIVKNYIELRYRLIPYIYSYAFKNFFEGETLIKPLIYEYQNDINVYNLDYEFLFGDNYLIAPILTQGQTTQSVYLPNNSEIRWMNYWTKEIYNGGTNVEVNSPIEQIPIFIKIPSITPLAKKKNFVAQSLDDTLYLDIYPFGNTDYELYEDDGETNDYKNGFYCKTKFENRFNNNFITFTINSIEGNYTNKIENRIWILKFNLMSRLDSIFVNNQKYELDSDSINFTIKENAVWYNANEKLLYVKIHSSTEEKVITDIYGSQIYVDIKDFVQPEFGFKLYQNYPNPMNPDTKIKFTIPASSKSYPKYRTFVQLNVYDILGNEVATLVNEEKSAGTYEVEFSGKGLSSGIYFYKLKAGKFVSIKKMILLK
ncbi:MAG: glycoside hydrolase family 31 protein [Ignavibacterium sp.]